MPTHERIKYKCGCYASGDNVSLWCPVHGLSGEFINVEAINSYFEQINKCQSCYELQQRLATAEAECDRLKAVLVKISEWGCNGQCYDLVKTLCPCCIAKQALEVDGGEV